jgi:hypothetical protein
VQNSGSKCLTTSDIFTLPPIKKNSAKKLGMMQVKAPRRYQVSQVDTEFGYRKRHAAFLNIRLPRKLTIEGVIV